MRTGWLVGHDPVETAGRVVPVRVGTWRARGRGAVLLLPGRGDSLELRAPLAERLASLGLTTVMPEHLGQGGSGRLGRHPDAVHVDGLQVHVEAAERALALTRRAAGAGPVLVLAHSMGGLVAAHLLARHHRSVAGAVVTAPLWGFAGPLPNGVVHAVAATAAHLGAGRSYAVGERPFSPARCLDMRTSSPGRRDSLARFASEHRELVRGGSTWQWVAAVAQGVRELHRLPLEQVTTPVTVLLARSEQTVDNTAARRQARRLPHHRVVELPGRHDLLLGGPEVEAAVVGWVAHARDVAVRGADARAPRR